jgi:hypothetical protein
VTGVCCFPVAAMSWRAAGRVRDRAEPGRPGAAPEASLRRPAGSPMMGRRETGAGGLAGVFGCAFRSVPWSVSGGRQCRWLHSSLRVSPARAGNAWGGPRQGAVRRGQSRRRPRRHERGGAENRATSRLAAGQESCLLFMPHAPAAVRLRRAWPGSGSHHRASRSRPG